MIKPSIKFILPIASILLLSGCGSESSSDTTSTKANNSTTIAKNNQEFILATSMKIDNLTVNTHNNTETNINKMYESLNNMLLDFTNINKSYSDRMNEEMKLLNTLAKAFEISNDYNSIFSVNENYNATTPAFSINKVSNKNYMLCSSSSKFYLKGKSIKTFFNDADSLSSAWKRAIQNANKNKDLYLNLVEVTAENLTNKITNSFIIKSSTLQTY